jgi:4-diphosphocytidyl-2-C-methyl-D-erythritol kinase
MTIIERAPAKINLALHVRARRPDGYHEIETLFAFLREGDTITVEEAREDRFAVTGPFAAGLATEGNNLVLAARDAFATAFGPLPSLAVTLDKHLPIASGIGGGSADAAATLRALAQLRPADPVRLFELALQLGSDVPACLIGTAAFGGGRGEQLATVAGLADIPVLLVNPGVAVSTGAVFATWDRVDRGPLAKGDPLSAALAGRNDLEASALALAPAIGKVLEILAAQPGVTLSRMSGSGATCFALFDSEAARSAASAFVAASHPQWWRLESVLA